MLLADFRTRVYAMAKTEGLPYLKPAVDVIAFYDLVQEALDLYTSRTHCLQADNVAFTPIVGTSSYDMSQTVSGANTYLTYRMCYVRQVMINSTYLASFNDLYGRPGPSSEYELTQLNGGFLTAANGPPAFWWQESPSTLRFDKGFDQAYSNCFIAGRRYHSAYGANDNVAIELAPEDVEMAAQLGASMLLRPFSRDKAASLRQECEAYMAIRKKECAARQAGGSSRGSPVPIATVNMARGGSGTNPRWRR